MAYPEMTDRGLYEREQWASRLRACDERCAPYVRHLIDLSCIAMPTYQIGDTLTIIDDGYTPAMRDARDMCQEMIERIRLAYLQPIITSGNGIINAAYRGG